MRTILLFAVIALITLPVTSCKKTVDKQKENYVLGVLTEGRWFLENFTENDVDNTFNFIAYEFQFYKSGQLDAISGGSVISGTWKGDASNLTIAINFPNSNTEINRLSHVWQWVKSNIGLVFAEYVTPTQKITIRLRKKI